MNIIVDSLPTKINIIWRSLVNISKVLEALEWLKVNNKHYKNIKINTDILNPIEDSEEIIIDQEENVIEREEKIDYLLNKDTKSFLLYRDHDYIIQDNFSVINLNEHDDLNWSDIEKYSIKRVTENPLSTRDVDLDHYCFPVLFPTGTG